MSKIIFISFLLINICLSQIGEVIPEKQLRSLKPKKAEPAPKVEDKKQEFKLFQTLEGHSGKINFVSYSLDGEKIVSASDDKTLRIWDAETGYCLNVLRGHSGGVKTASFSPDGMRIVSTSDDKTIRIWDVSTGQCFFIFNEDGLSFRSAVFSPKGKIISSLSDGTIRIYELPDINYLLQKNMLLVFHLK